MGLLQRRWKGVSLVREYRGYRCNNSVTISLNDDESLELEFEGEHLDKILGDKCEVLVTETRRLVFGIPHYSIKPDNHRVPTQEEIKEAMEWAEKNTQE
jgi:hypothetical protein